MTKDCDRVENLCCPQKKTGKKRKETLSEQLNYNKSYVSDVDKHIYEYLLVQWFLGKQLFIGGKEHEETNAWVNDFKYTNLSQIWSSPAEA